MTNIIAFIFIGFSFLFQTDSIPIDSVKVVNNDIKKDSCIKEVHQKLDIILNKLKEKNDLSINTKNKQL